ncbi:phage tail sheath family protein [Thermosulfuriphilus sp.]
MPEYLAPGVYIEEFEIGAKPIEGVSTSTAAFIGITERGPEALRLVTSFPEYQRIFGTYVPYSYLPYEVEGFFLNGGKRCYVTRVLGSEAREASGQISRNNKVLLKVSSKDKGEWGNRLVLLLRVDPNTKEARDLNIFYFVQKPTKALKDLGLEGNKTEVELDISQEAIQKKLRTLVSLAKAQETFPVSSEEETAYDLKDEVQKRSLFIKISEIAPEGEWKNLKKSVLFVLKGGANGSFEDKTVFSTPLEELEKIEDISLVYLPYPLVSNWDETWGRPFESTSYDSLIQDLIAHCENLMDRFLIIDCPPKQDKMNDAYLKPRSKWDTKYAAYYYPWIKIYDPLSKKIQIVPPGGYVAGVYARSDTERGVHKAPANEPLRGAVDLEYLLSKGQQDILNPRGVNCLRAFPGRGIRVWGARTLSSDPVWKYINVRRLFIFIEKSVERAIQWVVFEPNSERLWARVRQSVSEFLIRVWKDGALMGTTPEEAFFVKCDRTTMTQDEIDNGRLIVVVGVAPVRPAEFVIFRIAQWAGGSEISE